MATRAKVTIGPLFWGAKSDLRVGEFETSNAQFPILGATPTLGPVDCHRTRRHRSSNSGSDPRSDRCEYQDENAGFPFLVIGRTGNSAGHEPARRTDRESKQYIPATARSFPIFYAEDVGASNRDFTLTSAQRDRFARIPGESPLP